MAGGAAEAGADDAGADRTGAKEVHQHGNIKVAISLRESIIFISCGDSKPLPLGQQASVVPLCYACLLFYIKGESHEILYPVFSTNQLLLVLLEMLLGHLELFYLFTELLDF